MIAHELIRRQGNSLLLVCLLLASMVVAAFVSGATAAAQCPLSKADSDFHVAEATKSLPPPKPGLRGHMEAKPINLSFAKVGDDNFIANFILPAGMEAQFTYRFEDPNLNCTLGPYQWDEATKTYVALTGPTTWDAKRKHCRVSIMEALSGRPYVPARIQIRVPTNEGLEVRGELIPRDDMGRKLDTDSGDQYSGPEAWDRVLEIPVGSEITGHLFGNDGSDNYRLSYVPKGTTIHVYLSNTRQYAYSQWLTHDHPDGGNALEVYGTLFLVTPGQEDKPQYHVLHVGTQWPTEPSAPKVAELHHTVDRSGTYVVSVFRNYWANFQYRLRVEVTEPKERPAPTNIEIVTAEDPPTRIDEVAIGNCFRVMLKYDPNAAIDAERVSIRTESGGATTVIARPTKKPGIFLSPPVLVLQSQKQAGGK